MVDDDTKEAIRQAIGRGLENLLPEKTAEAILDAIDLDTVIEEGEIVDAVEAEQIGKRLGQLFGTIVGGKVGGKRGKTVGSMIGGQAGKKAVKILIEYTDTEAIANRLPEVIDPERINHMVKRVRDVIPRVRVPFRSETESS